MFTKLPAMPIHLILLFLLKNKVPLHKHLIHTETIFVLEGRGIFQQGDGKNGNWSW